MYRNYCKKCGGMSLYTKNSGNNVGLYCSDCGTWVKWLGKDELRAFEHSKEENAVNTQTLNDGIYMELFAVKDGVRYNAKIIDMKEVSTTLTNSLMDGIKKLWSDI